MWVISHALTAKSRIMNHSILDIPKANNQWQSWRFYYVAMMKRAIYVSNVLSDYSESTIQKMIPGSRIWSKVNLKLFVGWDKFRKRLMNLRAIFRIIIFFFDLYSSIFPIIDIFAINNLTCCCFVSMIRRSNIFVTRKKILLVKHSTIVV